MAHISRWKYSCQTNPFNMPVVDHWFLIILRWYNSLPDLKNKKTGCTITSVKVSLNTSLHLYYHSSSSLSGKILRLNSLWGKEDFLHLHNEIQLVVVYDHVKIRKRNVCYENKHLLHSMTYVYIWFMHVSSLIIIFESCFCRQSIV